MRFFELLEDMTDISGELTEELKTLEGVGGEEMIEVMKSLIYLYTHRKDDPLTEEALSRVGIIMPKKVYRDLKKFQVNVKISDGNQ
jgi:hypothetical protein